MSRAEDYEPIDCSVHDELESAVVLRRVCRVRWRADDGTVHETRSRLADVFASVGAEFLELSDGTRIRLDRIVEVRPVEDG